MTDVSLWGCTTEPLGNYLKALAVLRLIAEQADPDARGWWDEGHFHLRSGMDANALVDFFIGQYRPTPILSPWNAGSGFHTEKGKDVVDLIANSVDWRFAEYREAIALVRAIPEVAQAEQMPPPKENERRAAVLRACRNTLPNSAVEWLDAANAISVDGTRTTAPILGTGGNEGNLEYSNHFMKYLALLLLGPVSAKTNSSKQGGRPGTSLIRHALFGENTDGLEPSSVGQFDPGRAGGKNQGPRIMTEKVPSNPWNFVLTLEGATAWASGLYRRQGTSHKPFLCSPFTVKSTPVGYGSCASNDSGASRAEIWTPLWTQPARYAEVKNLFREGRASIESRPAQTGLEFAQAACTLGVDRGITGFVRYSLLERRGQGYYIALPIGRFPVTRRRETDLVRELTPVLESADRLLRDAPASYLSVRRQVDESIYQLLLRGDPDSLRDVAASFGRLHRWILSTSKPVRLRAGLSPSWLGALATLPEARIAGALAGIWDSASGSFREHLDRSSPSFAWTGRDLAGRLVRTLERRMIDAADIGRNPLRSAYNAPLTDAALFIEGSVDEDMIEDLLFAFSLVNWSLPVALATPPDRSVEVWPVYVLIKQLFLPNPVSTPTGDVFLRSDPRVLSLLCAGDVQAAAELALRRLQVAGLAPVQAQYHGGIDARRLAAALLIPVPYGRAMQKAVVASIPATR